MSDGKEYPSDTVLLHDFDRGPWAPSVSPYTLKLETFLRMAKIPYEVLGTLQYNPHVLKILN